MTTSGKREKVVEAMAIASLLVSEGVTDIAWATRCIVEGRAAKHYGDCTNVATGCVRCFADDRLAEAEAALAALHDAGYAVVPREPPTDITNTLSFEMDAGMVGQIYREMVAAIDIARAEAAGTDGAEHG